MNPLDSDLTIDQPPIIGAPTLTVDTTRTDLGPSTPAPQGYEILDEIGRGGMGVVYKARQRSLNRIVALKVILGAGHSSAAQHHRFRAEATAVASLHHPNIVQVFETGEQDGQPFIALEYIEGGSLAELLQGEPQLPTVAAELVRVLAIAVHHAHERQIVHRDLKPANVLLATKLSRPLTNTDAIVGVLKITDFGLAKQTGESHLTATGAILGTPSYMAPEQASGHGGAVGPAADVYALGGILYECLVGRPPFRAPTPMDTVLQVLHDDPVPPRQLQPTIPHDLETICLKCLAKKPEQRYSSAADLAEDLRRYATSEPIIARPTSRLIKGWKWSKRHPALATVAFVLAVPLPMLLGVLVFQFIDARAARILAEQAQRDEHAASQVAHREREAAIAAKIVAEQARQEERSATQKAERERAAAQAYLKSTISAVDRILDRMADPRLARLPGFQVDREAILNEGVALYEALRKVDSQEPTVRFEAAQAQNRVARLSLLAGRASVVTKTTGDAVQLLRPLVNEYPDNPDYRYELIKALQLRATAKMLVYDYDAAIGIANECVAECERLLATHPDNAKYQTAAGDLRRMLAMYHLRSNPLQARLEFERAVEHGQRAYAGDPSNDEHLGSLAFTLALYGKTIVSFGKFTEAEPILKQAKQLLDIKIDPSKSTGIGRELLENASVHYRAAQGEMLLFKNPTEALPYLRSVTEEFEALIKTMPKSFPYRIQAVQAYLVLHAAHKILKQEKEQKQVLDRGIVLTNDLIVDMPEAVWLTQLRYRFYFELVHYFFQQAQYPEALKYVVELEHGPLKPTGANAYNHACLVAKLALKVDNASRNELCNQAMVMLKHAARTGYPSTPSHIADIKADKDLDALIDRPDFQEWIKQLKPVPKK